jgi:hypothetical protein
MKNKQKINLLRGDIRTKDISLNKNSAKILGLKGYTFKTKQEADKVRPRTMSQTRINFKLQQSRLKEVYFKKSEFKDVSNKDQGKDFDTFEKYLSNISNWAFFNHHSDPITRR